MDEDGDLVIAELPTLEDFSVEGVEMLHPQLRDGASEITPDADPAPVSPVDYVWVYDKTPDFIFTELPGATKYKIEVWNIYTGALVYIYKGGPNCVAGNCKLLPTTALKNHDITNKKGYYRWRVKAKIGGFWQTEYSAYDYFYVLSTGFVSTFTTDAKKWLEMYGDWFITNKGYLKTKGVDYYYSSVVHKETFNDTYQFYAYEVKMKRKGGPGLESNRIIVAGHPDGIPENGWDSGYEFAYYDDTYIELLKRTDGSVDTVLCSGFFPDAVNEFDWNKVTFWKNYPWLTVWVNEVYVCDVNISADPGAYMGGYVGIMEYGWPDSAFLVDKASVWLSPYWPYSVDFADGVRVEVGVPAEGTQPRIDGWMD